MRWLAALQGPQDAVDSYLEQYARRRHVVLETLDRIGFTYGQPRGGFYVFLNAGSTGMPAEQLSRKLLTEAHVLIFPGTGFGQLVAVYAVGVARARGSDRRGDGQNRAVPVRRERSVRMSFTIAWVDGQPRDEVEFGQACCPTASGWSATRTVRARLPRWSSWWRTRTRLSRVGAGRRPSLLPRRGHG